MVEAYCLWKRLVTFIQKYVNQIWWLHGGLRFLLGDAKNGASQPGYRAGPVLPRQRLYYYFLSKLHLAFISEQGLLQFICIHLSQEEEEERKEEEDWIKYAVINYWSLSLQKLACGKKFPSKVESLTGTELCPASTDLGTLLCRADISHKDSILCCKLHSFDMFRVWNASFIVFVGYKI